MQDIIYVCKKCSYSRTIKPDQIVAAEALTHCSVIMNVETESFRDGIGSGYHYYRECAERGSTENLTERWITEYGRYLLSIKYYSLVPREWMSGFMAGWKIGKENAEA